MTVSVSSLAYQVFQSLPQIYISMIRLLFTIGVTNVYNIDLILSYQLSSGCSLVSQEPLVSLESQQNHY